MQVLVIGDVMLDIYRSGKISRMSPEAPVPVILNAQDTFAAGGAANVAVNLATMGLDVSLAGIVGSDINAGHLQQILDEAKIESHLFVSESQPTISKMRVLGNGHHLVRIDMEGDFTEDAASLFQDTYHRTSDWVVLSDYQKGTLSRIEKYISEFQSKGSKVFVDPKREMAAYKGAWFIKPNKNEFTKYVGAFSSHAELVEKAQAAVRTFQFEHMLITLGSEGMMYVTATSARFFPSVSQQVADITGAGDTVLAGLVYGLARGYDMDRSILLAKKLAEISVTKVGTYVITQEDIAHLTIEQ